MSATATYTYRARDSKGRISTGQMTGRSPEEVSARLRAEGQFVLSVEDRPLRAEIELDADQIRLNEAAKRVRRQDVIAFCQQLAVMLETGVPLSEALDAFFGQSRSREMRLVLAHLRNDVYGGMQLSSAMARWPRVFPPMVVSLTRASEASGTLALMLGRVGEYLANERRIRRQVRGALAYPLFMVGSGLAMTAFLMAFVLPRFANIYQQRSATLPAPTRVLIAVSDAMTAHYPIYLPLLVAVVAGAAFWVRQPSGRRAADWLKLHLPLAGPMYRQLYIARAARTMSTLLGAGVNVMDIIDICRGVTGNTTYARLWDEMESGVREGKQLSDAALDSPLIPGNIASMISAGERSGRLPQVMDRIAAFSEEELETSVKQVSSFIEPVMIIVMGAIIGGIAMALLLPVFSMGKVLTGG